VTWWRTAKAGDKVVCVRDDFRPNDPSHQWPVPEKGEVYTFIAVPGREFEGLLDTVYVTIEGFDAWFDSRAFRPVQPKHTETGMKMIRAILDRVTVKVDA